MATLHGRNGMVYMGSASNGAPGIVTEAHRFTIKVDRALDTDSAFGDTWVTNLEGLKSWSGSFEGRFDTAQAIPFVAATAVGTVGIYIYPDRATLTNYYYGYCYPTVSADVGLTSTGSVTCDFTGDGALSTKA